MWMEIKILEKKDMKVYRKEMENLWKSVWQYHNQLQAKRLLLFKISEIIAQKFEYIEALTLNRLRIWIGNRIRYILSH